MNNEKRQRILKELEGMTETEWSRLKIDIESNLVYLPNFHQNKDAILNICKDSVNNCGDAVANSSAQA